MVQYAKESYEELKNRVMWPTFANSQREMVVMVVFSILFSLVIRGMNSFFEWIIAEYFKFMQ